MNEIIKKGLILVRNCILGFFSIVFVMGGFLYIFDSIIFGILLIIGGLLIFPVFVNFLYENIKKTKIKNIEKVSKSILYCVGALLLFVAFAFFPVDTEDKNYLDEEKVNENNNSQKEDNEKDNTSDKDLTENEKNNNTDNKQSNSNNDNSSANYSNINKLSSKQKDNFIVALKECKMDPSKVKNVSKLDDWNNGSRYSFSYSGDTLYLYINDDDTINSMNLSLGGLHIYDEKYESLDYNDYSISVDFSYRMRNVAEEYVSAVLKDPSSAKYNWTSYQRSKQYYAISGTFSAKNSFGQKVTSNAYIEFELENKNLSVVYTLIDGKSSGKKVVPEVKRVERETTDTSDNNLITLKDGVVGNYGKYDTMDGEKYLRYYVPIGKYKVKALVKNSMFYVESIKLHKEDGYDTPTTYNTVKLANKNDTQTIEVKNGQCISLVIGTKIELTKIN